MRRDVSKERRKNKKIFWSQKITSDNVLEKLLNSRNYESPRELIKIAKIYHDTLIKDLKSSNENFYANFGFKS